MHKDNTQVARLFETLAHCEHNTHTRYKVLEGEYAGKIFSLKGTGVDGNKIDCIIMTDENRKIVHFYEDLSIEIIPFILD